MLRMTPEADRQSQLLRGVLDMCLLALLQHQPSHAYDLTARLEQSGMPGVGYGTLYPLVTRLRRQGLLNERVQTSTTGPPRKVYRPSAAGRAALAAWTSQWLASTTAIRSLLADAGALPATFEESR